MVKMFTGYQHFREYMAYVYTTEEVYKQFITKKMLGLKEIKLKGALTQDATHVIDLKAHGVIEAKATYYDLDGIQRITLKLK